MRRGCRLPAAAGVCTTYNFSNKKHSNGKGAKKPKQGKEKQEDAAQPPRIVDTSFLSLKTQLRFVNRAKRAEGDQSQGPVQRSSFRRSRELAKERAAADAAKLSELAAEDAQLRRGRGLSSLYNTKAQRNPPAVLVDGYNVLMMWLGEPGDLERKARVAGSLEAAREELLRDLLDFSGFKRFRIMVAFDAHGNTLAPALSRAQRRHTVHVAWASHFDDTHADQVGGVEVVFVGSGEADSFIIGEAQQLRQAGCPHVLVATSDNDIRDSCWTNEIFPITSSSLLREMRRAKKEAEAFFKRQESSRLNKSRLGAALLSSNPGLYEKLESLRLQQRRD